jgi:hypothetical protein
VYTTRTPTGGTGDPTVYALMTTAKPSCGGTLFTISVYDATGTTLLDSQTFTGDDMKSSFSYSFSPGSVASAPKQVCIVATSARDGHVIDSAPDSGCYVLVQDISPGGSGLN